MQPDFGSTVSSPNGQFSFPRSYITQLQVSVANAIPLYFEGLLTISYPTFDVTEIVIFRDYFHPWSSNAYTLDGIVQYVGYFFNSDPGTVFPALLAVNYGVLGDPPAPTIQVAPDGNAGPPEFYFSLPAAPPDYWKP